MQYQMKLLNYTTSLQRSFSFVILASAHILENKAIGGFSCFGTQHTAF